MKRLTLGLLALSTGLAAAGCTTHYHRMRDLDEMVLWAQNVDRQFVTAFNKGDIDNVMDCYWNSPELTVYPPDALEAKGWEAVKANYINLFKTTPGAKLVLIDAHYQPVGDGVEGWGTWTLSIPPAPGTKGEATLLHGRYTALIARQNGKWVYVLDHASAPLQATEMAPAATMPATTPK